MKVVRSSAERVRDILRVLSNRRNIGMFGYVIGRTTNQQHKIQELLSLLIKSKLIEYKEYEQTHRYFITEKGVNMLIKLNENLRDIDDITKEIFGGQNE